MKKAEGEAAEILAAGVRGACQPGCWQTGTLSADRPNKAQGPDRRLRWSGPWLLSQHSAHPKGFEPLTF